MRFYYKQEVYVMFAIFSVVGILFSIVNGWAAGMYIIIIFGLYSTIHCNYYSIGFWEEYIEVKKIYGRNMRYDVTNIKSVILEDNELILPMLGSKRLMHIELVNNNVEFNIERICDKNCETELIKFCNQHQIPLLLK